MPQSKSFYTKVFILCFKVLLWLYVAAAVVDAYAYLRDYVFGFPGSWCYSDMLVNYAGGLARRGLLGEIFYAFSVVTGMLPHYVFVPVCLAFAVFFIGFLAVKMCRRGVYWWILATPLMFGACYENIIRKDFIILTIMVGCLYLCRPMRLDGALRLVLIVALCLLALMIYEPAFFIFMPMLALVIWRSPDFGVGRVAKVAAYVVILLFMGWQLSLIGSIDKAMAIHNSWHNLFPEFIGENAGLSIKAIAWNIHDSLDYNKSVLLQPFSPTMVGLLILLPFGYYVFSRYVFAARRQDTTPVASMATWSLLVLMQMLSLTPMWLGLSCDFGRMLMYVMATSLCAALILPRHTVDVIMPQPLINVMQRVQKVSTRLLPANIYVICTLLAVAPVTFSFFTVPALFKGSMVYQVFELLWYIVNVWL